MNDLPDQYIDTIICGDSAVVLKGIQDESIDCMVADPPYGMSFMGKAWDKALPPVAIWKECLRVLKPGAFAFVMCIPRQDCLSRMIRNLEDAGFMVNFTPIYWTFATGFPKALNIAKNIDKRVDKRMETVYSNYYHNMEELLCSLGNANNADKIFNSMSERDESIISPDVSVQAPVTTNTEKLTLSQSIPPDSNRVSDAESLSEKSKIETGTRMPKSDFVLINVCEKTLPKRSQPLNAIIAELSSEEASLTLERVNNIAQENASLSTSRNRLSVCNAEKDSALRKAPTGNTVQKSALIMQCENIMDRIRADEALKIELGNRMSLSETATSVSYAGLIDALKHTILNQSKTFQNLGTSLQTELFTAMTIIITKSTMECLISFMADMWGIKLGEKEIKEGSYLSRFIDKRAGIEREVVGKKAGTYADIKRDKETGQDSLHGGIATERQRVECNITTPATPEAKALDGAYTFSPKPAVEVVLVAQKPKTEKTYIDQALMWYNERETILSEIESELSSQCGIAQNSIEWEE